jgi:YidC/Oxa1 family membrane protein insertase
MKKTRIFMIFLAIAILFGAAGCSGKKGEVSYNNFNSVTVKTEETAGTNYYNVLILLGQWTSETGLEEDTDFDSSNKTGILYWDLSEEQIHVKITLENDEVTAKEQTGLYESVYRTPIGTRTGVWEWVITQIGIFTFHASNLFGLLGGTYLYWLGLLIMTLVIRTLGWPIYAKSNDMTYKMNMAQPELGKIQEKYRGRTDQASQQRMQMETMEVYKKYKINLFGCLMPLLQMPIFIAMYQVVQRFPLTDTGVFGNAAVTMNTTFLWTNLGNTAWLANLPLAIIVGGTMFLSQWLMTKRQKAQQKQHNRYVDPKTQQSQKMMKFMMYFMVLMMAYIAIGNAGIAFYWIIGNCYQLFQSYIGHKQSDKRQAQLRKQF